MKCTFNENHNSIEISFDAKPSADIRDNLKKHGFKWHNLNKLWYAKATEKTSLFAAELFGYEKRKVNKYGVGVGDIFRASWGYDQTNVDFFQVIALVGEASVRVRQVDPVMIEETATSWASADRTYQMTKEILPPSRVSVFIKDQEKGDLKRVSNKYYDHPYIKISSFADARLVTTDTITVYESWYA